MKLIIQNIVLNRTTYKIISIVIASLVNLIFIILLLFAIDMLFSYGLAGKNLLYLIIFFLLTVLPLLNYFLNKMSSVITPEGDIDLYVKTVDSIISTESFDEIIYKIFDLIIKLLKAGSGHIMYYRDDSEVLDIKYVNDKTHDISERAKTETDKMLLSYVRGPDDVIIKSTGRNPGDRNKDIYKALETLNADIIVPLFYNNIAFGFITIGQKTRFTDKEINLLKITAFKLALVSVNSYHFQEITKRREVEKEYELTNKIQRQFLPEPDLNLGRINIRAYHETTSSLTREFYDIFVNDASAGDVRVSAYRVSGDVKETSILMPGIQAVLQCYTRLGFTPKKALSGLINLEKKRGVLSGSLMIFHSSIKQSGEFVCCYSNYPAPFLFQRKSKKLIHLEGKGRRPAAVTVKMNSGDFIIAAGTYYFRLITENFNKFAAIINKYSYLNLDEIKSLLINALDETDDPVQKDYSCDHIEGKDKLLILAGIEDAN